MPIDYSVLALPKGKPKSIAKDERDRDRKNVDERENDKVKARSGGQCEIQSPKRCQRRANQVHHMISGIGRRARGPSLLAKHKQHTCTECHGLITSKRFVRIGTDLPSWTDSYRRIRASREKE